MKKILLILILLLAVSSDAFAGENKKMSGYLYYGKYFNSNYYGVDNRIVKYRAGIHIDIKPFEEYNTYIFLEDETLVDERVSSVNFHPMQINYKIGLIHKIDDFTVIFKHECLHPIDGIHGSYYDQEYDLIELRYNF